MLLTERASEGELEQMDLVGVVVKECVTLSTCSDSKPPLLFKSDVPATGSDLQLLTGTKGTRTKNTITVRITYFICNK